MKYLLDTDICIKLMRGNVNVANNLFSAGEEAFSVSEVTLAELRYGAEFSQRPFFRHAEIDNFRLVAQTLPILKVIPTYAVEKARIQRSGLLIPDFDLLIGATALTYNLILVTNNVKHFARLTGITLENWLTDPPPPAWMQS